MQTPHLGLIDYGSGNLRSVSKALSRVGAHVELIRSPAALGGVEAVVLPGVGAFGDCADQLRQRGLWEPLAAWLARERPFLGICLGYQLLFESSEESPGVAGFGHFKGQVRRFRSPGLKVPQIGWNALEFTQADVSLWTGLEAGSHVYFVHSFFPEPGDPAVVSATASYGERFAAAAARGPVQGVQFHPEKSQDVGLTMLGNFVRSLRVHQGEPIAA